MPSKPKPMGRWKNFSIWKGRLPHWRADGVTYYVTFRHRRELTEDERHELFMALMRAERKGIELDVLCVLPETTEMLFSCDEGVELSDVIEKSKKRAGTKIVKKSGERWPPFYFESYDRIVRDEEELAERWEAIVGSPEKAELTEDFESYPTLWVASRSSSS